MVVGLDFLAPSPDAQSMTSPQPKKKLPRDANQLAKSIVDIATGSVPPEPEESAKAVAGRKGGLKGGTSRAGSLTAKQRSDAARKAAKSRWDKAGKEEAEADQNKSR